MFVSRFMPRLGRRYFSSVKYSNPSLYFNKPSPVLFNVVYDIEDYKNFIPYCSESKILAKHKKYMEALLTVDFGLFTETYVSKVTVFKSTNPNEPSFIHSASNQEGLFKKLESEWRFYQVDKDKTRVEYRLEFEFKNPVYQRFSNMVIDKVGKRILEAFAKRFKTVQMQLVEEVNQAVDSFAQWDLKPQEKVTTLVKPEERPASLECDDMFDLFGTGTISMPSKKKL
eukprot:TRINITY_DN10564_c0_g1_i1.p1 TRINITY_DN10564_c0_g1~~TRINITY_DN10564_c0_g1_i1.p1  ORF type:complete len:227 (+),score=31.13 TRINITY_DN10564_c0_g1_i1:33-713(+)